MSTIQRHTSLSLWWYAAAAAVVAGLLAVIITALYSSSPSAVVDQPPPTSVTRTGQHQGTPFREMCFAMRYRPSIELARPGCHVSTP